MIRLLNAPIVSSKLLDVPSDISDVLGDALVGPKGHFQGVPNLSEA